MPEQEQAKKWLGHLNERFSELLTPRRIKLLTRCNPTFFDDLHARQTHLDRLVVAFLNGSVAWDGVGNYIRDIFCFVALETGRIK